MVMTYEIDRENKILALHCVFTPRLCVDHFTQCRETRSMQATLS